MPRELKATQRKTIDERFDDVTQAFAEVAHAFADQRNYTTFCFEKLQREVRQDMKQSEGRLTRRLDRHEVMLGEILSEVKAIRPRAAAT